MAMIPLDPEPLPFDPFLTADEIEILNSRAEILEEYFSIKISNNQLTHLPYFSGGIVKPDWNYAPEFLRCLAAVSFDCEKPALK